MSAMDANVSSVQSLQAEANAQMIQNNVGSMSGVSGSAGTATFNGTISDLMQKYPDIYNKLVLQQLAYEIVQQCQDENDHYLEVIKENDRH